MAAEGIGEVEAEVQHLPAESVLQRAGDLGIYILQWNGDGFIRIFYFLA